MANKHMGQKHINIPFGVSESKLRGFGSYKDIIEVGELVVV
jgi:hypothetical protein